MLRGLLVEVRDARVAALEVLTEAEATKPKHNGSSQFSWTIEDPLRDIVAHEKDPRRGDALAALHRFQAAVNAALEYEVAERWHEKFAALWLNPKGSGKLRPTSAFVAIDEVKAEVSWALRGMLAYVADPSEVEARQSWADYCFVSVKRHLDEWSNRIGAPVEVPRAVARDSQACDMTSDLDPLHESESYDDAEAYIANSSPGFEGGGSAKRCHERDGLQAVLEELTVEQRRRIFG